MLVLKKNTSKSLSKLKPKYLGPYTIVSKCGNNNFKLKDNFLHFLKTSIHSSRLVHFYDDKLYKVNNKDQVDGESFSGNGMDDKMSYCSDFESEGSNITSCKRAREYQPSKNVGPLTSTPVKSQIIIASSKEMPPSSDESETIDVCSPYITDKNPFGDMDVLDIPIEIVDDLNDLNSVDVTVTEVQGPPACFFTPLTDEDWVCAALKFSLVINAKSHSVPNYGVGNIMSNPPKVSNPALGNGACLFNSFSLLLCG